MPRPDTCRLIHFNNYYVRQRIDMTLSSSFKFDFNRRSTAEQVTEGVDLSGKTILITGVGSGLGYETLRVLAKRGAHVIGIDRTMDAAKKACDETPGVTTPFACDLSDPDSIVACTKAISEQFSLLDVVITNAGIMAPPLTLVHKYKEPLELQFAVNFLGNFVLINHLMPLLKAAPSARIVLVASGAYVVAPKEEGITFDNLDWRKDYDGLAAYGHSKLAVMLMNRVLAERLQGTKVTSNAIHPGLIRTKLAGDTKTFKVKFISWFGGPFMRSIPQGAATQCLVATHSALDGVSGEHFADCNLKEAVGHATDMALAKKLWEKATFLSEDYLITE
jgi:NAD(P)-dependent dehydrogenase (short-subunit alcohol dehydrogenase family)